MNDSVAFVAGEEILFRRIKDGRGHYVPETGWVASAAFRAMKHDTTGISVDRERYRTAEQSARSSTVQGTYYVVRLKVARVRSLKLDVVSCPEVDNPGHAEIPEIRYETRRETEQEQLGLSRVCFGAEGPFSVEHAP